MLKLVVIGNLGKDATVNDVNEQKVINFSVAHTEKWTDAKGAAQERTLWVECAKWGDKIAVAEYMKKGTQVYVEGQPDVVMYDKNDGSKGISLKCRVGVVQLLGGKKQKGQAENGSSEQGTEEKKADKKMPF